MSVSVSIGRTSVRAASSFKDGSATTDCTETNENIRHAAARLRRMNPSLPCDVRGVSRDTGKSRPKRARTAGTRGLCCDG